MFMFVQGRYTRSVLRRVTVCTLLAALRLVCGEQAWKPALNTSWQWQLTTPVDQSADAAMYDIDLFDNDASVVASLHAQGRKVICYVSVGTFEPWRPDASRFPEAVKGRSVDGFADEKWLDIRRLDVIGPIMEARMDLCRSKGFDGVEPDNVDAYANRSGFPLTGQDQLRYNIFIAGAAHARGLSVGLKNDLDQVRDLLAHFDWALNEQCFQYRECSALAPFVGAGKAVFQVEYKLEPSQFCAEANALNFNSLRKNLDLNAYRVPCRESAAGPSLTAVLNSASQEAGAISPGEVVTVLGAGMGPAAGLDAQLAAPGQVGVQLDGTRILFGGVAAPLLYLQTWNAMAVTPYAVEGKTRVEVRIERNGVASAPLTLPVVSAAPGIWQASMLNQNGTPNSPGNPALPGSVVVFFATGAGATQPAGKDGLLSSAPYPVPVLPVGVRVGGMEAEVLFAGMAPGLVAGILQVNIRVPAGAEPGSAVPVALSVGGRESSPAAALAVSTAQ